MISAAFSSDLYSLKTCGFGPIVSELQQLHGLHLFTKDGDRTGAHLPAAAYSVSAQIDQRS